ncbi:MAG: ATP-dependent Clp protease proteolytic subunit [Planctomycetales bacterium]|nr:ATP-dependent Clp protease proteolytic subunit [Planctomycetales bacterium]
MTRGTETEGARDPRGVVFVPHVWETTGQGEREFDLFSRLLKDRIIFVGTEITDHVANLVVAQMLFLQTEDRKREIALYLNSPGGFVTSGLAIYDTMKFVQCDVATYCLGSASSMAAVLLAAGTKGKRFALPHSRIMIHQPWGRATGTAADIRIHAEEINRMKRRVNEILSDHSGQAFERVEKDTDRDRYMSADEAKAYGLVDEVVQSLKTPGVPQGQAAGR